MVFILSICILLGEPQLLYNDGTSIIENNETPVIVDELHGKK